MLPMLASFPCCLTRLDASYTCNSTLAKRIARACQDGWIDVFSLSASSAATLCMSCWWVSRSLLLFLGNKHVKRNETNRTEMYNDKK